MAKEILNCPNCGAPITGDRCEYCGTQLSDDTETVEFYADNRVVMRMEKHNGEWEVTG